YFFFSSRRRHTRSDRDWSSDVCSSDLSVSARSATARPRRSSKGDVGGGGGPDTTYLSAQDSAARVGRLYAANTVGAIVGALATKIGRASCRESRVDAVVEECVQAKKID